MPFPVSATSITALPPERLARSTISPSCVCLTRVADEVREHLLENVATTEGGDGPEQSTRTRAPSSGIRDDHLFEQRLQVDRLERDRLVPGLRAREGEERAGQTREAGRLPADQVDERGRGSPARPALPSFSASTALAIAATGVRSSCEAFATNSCSACRSRSCSVMSATTSTTRSDGAGGNPDKGDDAPVGPAVLGLR